MLHLDSRRLSRIRILAVVVLPSLGQSWAVRPLPVGTATSSAARLANWLAVEANLRAPTCKWFHLPRRPTKLARGSRAGQAKLEDSNSIRLPFWLALY